MSSILGGRQERATQGLSERNYIRTGESLLERGRRLSNPNLLFLKEKAPVSESDRANALAASKAATAQAGGTAVPAVLTGLRGGGVGINSANARLALDDAAYAAGAAHGANQVATGRALDAQDLDTNATLAQTAVTGTGEALKGLRASVSAQNMSRMLQTLAGNEARKARATELTNLGLAGIKGLGRLGASRGTIMQDGTISFNDANPFSAWLARAGFLDETALAGKANAYMANPTGYVDDGRVGFGGFFRSPASLLRQNSVQLGAPGVDWENIDLGQFGG